MVNDPIIEQIPLNRPFLWMEESAWEYLSDYIDDDEYYHYDDMYRLILGSISWEDYAKFNYPEKNLEEVKRAYQENFPKLMADAMIAIAQDIKDGSLVIKFDEIEDEKI